MTEPKKIPQEARKIPVPAFNAGRAFQYIEKQISFGPRVPNMEGHKACRNWLIQTLRDFGAAVLAQEFKPNAFDGTTLEATNIIARFNPEVEERVLLCAHWDTRPFADKDSTR